MTKPLRLKITDVARREIKEFLDRSGLSDPLPGLLFGSRSNESNAKWQIGAYTRTQALELEHIYAPKALAVLYEADGIELVVPQPQLIEKLDGKTLDYRNNEYTIVGQ